MMAIDNINELGKLNYNKQLVFAYLTCERLYPNYAFFSENFDFGAKQTLRKAIDYISTVLLISDFPSKDEIETHLSAIEPNTPFPQNFETILSSSALDSCTAILETLQFMLDRKKSRLKDISTFATDTVDMYIGDRDKLDFNTDPDFDRKIFNDPLMQREHSIQNGIISYLNKIEKLELPDINNLLNLQFNNNRSNIDLS